MTIRLLALPPGATPGAAALAELEKLASQVLREIAALRASAEPTVGEKRGLWRIPQDHSLTFGSSRGSASH